MKNFTLLFFLTVALLGFGHAASAQNSVCEGGSATFSVSSGYKFYQWYR
jgi:hypothetical protein